MKYTRLKNLPKEKLAVISLDFEEDYGGRVNQFNLINMKKELEDLIKLKSKLKFEISTFIQLNLIEKNNDNLNTLKLISNDFHAHTYSHKISNFELNGSKARERDIFKSYEVFAKIFNYSPIGYRAPQGVLKENDFFSIQRAGFKFSSSMFPSYRYGKYNNLNFPLEPVLYENQLYEIPMAAIPYIRYPLTISYLKLSSFFLNQIFFKLLKLPDILIIDSHLHDLIVNKKSYSLLSKNIQFAYSINKYKGMSYLERLILFLKHQGYQFTTISNVYNLISKNTLK